MAWTAEHATRELLQLLPLLNRIIAAEVRDAAGEETTMPQFRVLEHLAEEPLTLSALARRRRVSLQAMSVLVHSLVTRGWIERTPDLHDRRQQLLALSDHGRAHYERAQAQLLRHLRPVIESLQPQELQAVEQALPALRRVLTRDDAAATVAREEASAWS